MYFKIDTKYKMDRYRCFKNILNYQSQAEISQTADCDRSFISFGKINSGKSTLGNLLLGDGATAHFETHPFHESSGHTKKVQSGETEIEASIIYGEGYGENKKLKIQVVDGPGCNDYDYKFSYKHLRDGKSKMHSTILILIDLNSSYFSPDDFISIMKMAESVAENSHSIFPNAVVVFTHADKLDRHLNKEILEEKMHQKLEQENYAYIKELLKLVGERYIFINGEDHSEMNRNRILKNIFKLTKPNLNVYVNGNDEFEGNELKELLGKDTAVRSIRYTNSLEHCDVEYFFNPETNLYKRNDTMGLKDEIINALDKLIDITKGISTVIILINLEKTLDKDLYDQILNLPNTYNLGERRDKGFWNHACIVFKVQINSSDFVKRQIESNSMLRNLERIVQSRYSWITDRTTPEQCFEILVRLVQRVSNYTKWKTYTDSIVLGEMSEIIQKSFSHKTSSDQRIIAPGTETSDMPHTGGAICKLCPDIEVLRSINHFFWGTNHTGISSQIGHFIWKNINPEIAKRFMKRYPNDKISIQVYADFCLEAMRDM